MNAPVLLSSSLVDSFWDVRHLSECTLTIRSTVIVDNSVIDLPCIVSRVIGCYNRFDVVVVLVRCMEPTAFHSLRVIQIQDYLRHNLTNSYLGGTRSLVLHPVHEKVHVLNVLNTLIAGFEPSDLARAGYIMDSVVSDHPELGGCTSSDRWAQTISACTQKQGGLTLHDIFVLQDGCRSFRSIVTANVSQLQGCSLDKETALSVFEFFHPT
ncbi:hypothetical protein BASA60_010782 [Batrachochytrium salamandrivorans]|nr:hypothetical protein BASA60_010782 [Batrachochytrium salamandrivorans]